MNDIAIGVIIAFAFFILTILLQMLNNYLDHKYTKTRIIESAILREKIESLKSINFYLEENIKNLFYQIKDFKNENRKDKLDKIKIKIQREIEGHDKKFSTTDISLFESKKIFEEYNNYANMTQAISKLLKEDKDKKTLNIELSQLIEKIIGKRVDIINEIKKEIYAT